MVKNRIYYNELANIKLAKNNFKECRLLFSEKTSFAVIMTGTISNFCSTTKLSETFVYVWKTAPH